MNIVKSIIEKLSGKKCTESDKLGDLEKLTDTINIEELYKYESSRWDMNISLKEVLEHSKVCKVDREYRAHKSDDCYHGYCMYVKHPDSDNYRTQIGIFEDGFTYLGDGTGGEDLPFEDIDNVLKEMFIYGEYIKNKDNLD